MAEITELDTGDDKAASASDEKCKVEPVKEKPPVNVQQDQGRILGQIQVALNVRDEFSVFGEFIAHKLRSLDPRLVPIVQQQIQNVLANAETSQLFQFVPMYAQPLCSCPFPPCLPVQPQPSFVLPNILLTSQQVSSVVVPPFVPTAPAIPRSAVLAYDPLIQLPPPMSATPLVPVSPQVNLPPPRPTGTRPKLLSQIDPQTSMSALSNPPASGSRYNKRASKSTRRKSTRPPPA